VSGLAEVGTAEHSSLLRQGEKSLADDVMERAQETRELCMAITRRMNILRPGAIRINLEFEKWQERFRETLAAAF